MSGQNTMDDSRDGTLASSVELGDTTSSIVSPPRICQISCWVKYSLFTINFIIWVSGCVIVAVGTWARLQRAGLQTFDTVLTDPAYVLIAAGVVMFVISVFGCLGALRENLCLLKTFVVTIVLVFILQVVSGVLAFVFMETLEQKLLDYMRDVLAQEYDQPNSDARDAVDYLQSKYFCCGAASYQDWEVNAYFNCSSPALSHCGVPKSCCRVPTNVQCGYQTRKYTEAYASQLIYTAGCIHALMTIFKDNLVVIGLIAFCVGFLELFTLLLANHMMRTIIAAGKTRV